MEELAEVLAVDFGDKEGMPKLNPNWRWGDEEQAVLTSCSSLIAVVESDDTRVVQFSHFSVKEYLTSDRLATSNGDISRYHIDLQLAHTILAQACISVLLRSDDRVEEGGAGNISPLARYAAEHWVVHAKDEKVSSSIRKAMEYLFDVDKPYFTAWLELYDIDTDASDGSTFFWLTERTNPGSPLYYAARCGFQDVVELLVARDPTQSNVTGGYYRTPFVAALGAGHFQTAKFLYDNGAHPNVRGYREATPLHSAAYFGDLEMVQVLLEYKADVHARRVDGKTPLVFASEGFYQGVPNTAVSFSNVARVLLERGADVNAQDGHRSTALHSAARSARHGRVEAIHVLLEHGADVNAQMDNDTTPLHEAARDGTVEAIRALLEHGANVNARKNDDTTPLHEAAGNGSAEAIRILLEHGADMNTKKNDDTTVLHEAARSGSVEAIRALVKLGADVNARKNDDTTALHEGARSRSVEAIRALVELGADVNVRKNDNTTLLHIAVEDGFVDGVLLLLEHGANVGAEDSGGRTASQVASEMGYDEIAILISEHGAV